MGVVYVLLAIDTHHLCNEDTNWCFNFQYRVLAAIGVFLWVISVFEELLSFLAHVQEGWIGYYIHAWCRSGVMSFTYVRIANIVSTGFVLLNIIYDGEEHISERRNFRVVFALSCLLKW